MSADPIIPEVKNKIEINANYNLSDAMTDLLKQIANSSTPVNNVQFTINLTQSTPSVPALPTGVSIRQVFADPQNNGALKVRISFVPDDPKQPASTIVKDHDIGEKDDWERILGNPENVNIDTGIAVLRVSEDVQGGVTTWLPNDNTQNIIVFESKPPAPEPGQPVDLAAFLSCMSTKTGIGRSYPDALSACLNQW
jgi:hypothetical protein